MSQFTKRDKLRYAILQEIYQGRATGDMPERLGVDREEWEDEIRFLDREGLITKPMYADNQVFIIVHVKLTGAGESYLKENSALSKAYAAAKEIRDWINAIL